MGDIIFAITEFEADRYAWYVNMFIGLYLMIPFLNKLIIHLNKNEYRIWITVLLLIITVPFTINPLFILFFNQSHAFFPNWWMGIYPLLFYFIGAYIHKFKPKVSKTRCVCGILLLLCLQTAFTYCTDDPKLWNDIATITMVSQSTLIFLLCYQVQIRSNTIRKGFQLVSGVTLEMLLFSNISDEFLYKALPVANQHMIFLKYYIPIVGILIAANFIFAYTYAKGLYKIMKITGIQQWIYRNDIQ